MQFEMGKACSWDGRNLKYTYNFGGISDGKRPLYELGEDGKVILKWILKKQGEKLLTEFI
jgi:hypothetical protein